MIAPGRLLRLFRFTAGLSLDSAASASSLPVARIRRLEAGAADLGYLEGLVLAKTYLLCPNCFARHFRSAAAHDGLAGRFEDASGAEPADGGSS